MVKRAVKDAKETFDAEAITVEPAKNPSTGEVNAHLSSEEIMPLPPNVNNEAFKGVEKL